MGDLWKAYFTTEDPNKWGDWWKTYFTEDPNKWSKKDLGLMDKFKEVYKNPDNHRNDGRYVSRPVFALTAVACAYTTIFYIIPHICKDRSDMTEYYYKVGYMYLIIQVLSNWLCTIMYTSFWDKDMTRDRPHFVRNHDSSPHFGMNGSAGNSNNSDHNVTNDGFSAQHYVDSKSEDSNWTYCEQCEIHSPPRSHHCVVCNKCVLKRDHHCYLVGACIGFWNQRYFVVLSYYVGILGFLTIYLSTWYLYDHLHDSIFWTDYIPFVTLWNWVTGKYTFHIAVMLLETQILTIFSPMASVYFLVQVIIICQGKTSFELLKSVKMKVTSTMKENWKSVFGDLWILNFYLPAQIAFRQEGNGLQWDGVKFYGNRNRRKV